MYLKYTSIPEWITDYISFFMICFCDFPRIRIPAFSF